MPLPATLPAKFGRYQLLKELGRGGMGVVYLAEDTRLCRRVALKVPTIDSAAAVQRFEREARAAAAVEHPNLCPIHEIDCVDDVHYLTMPFIEGQTLDKLISGGSGLPIRQAVTIAHKLTHALEELHQHGLIHRDLKPSNVMLKHGREPILMDFGLARNYNSESEQLTKTDMVLGTAAYMSPEQANGNHKGLGPATDIHSLGVILFEMLTGRRPFAADNREALFAQIFFMNPRPRPSLIRTEVDPDLDDVCATAMAKEPKNRFAGMGAFAAALAPWLETPILPANVLAMPPAAQQVTCPSCHKPLVLSSEHWGKAVRCPVCRSTFTPNHLATLPGLQPQIQPNVQAKELLNAIGMKLVLIPAGQFKMGSPDDEVGHGSDEFLHDVAITKPFYLGIHEVTQDQYERVMGTNPSSFSATGASKNKVAGLDTRRFPVEHVSWNDADDFCKKLSALPEEKRAGRVYGLPTEAQWEYACRGGSSDPGPFFFKHPSRSLSSLQANFDGNHPYGGAAKSRYLERPVPVDDPGYEPNGFGLFHMHGNVWEWCQDWYDANFDKSSRREDPRGPPGGSVRVIRGGGWLGNGQLCRAAGRNWVTPAYRNYFLGFRVALVPSGQ